jgi:hypothetical protein
MADEPEKDDDLKRPFSPSERQMLRELMENYSHSRWLFLATIKTAKFVGAIIALVAAYKAAIGIGVIK